jgi:hypothetical protein
MVMTLPECGAPSPAVIFEPSAHIFDTVALLQAAVNFELFCSTKIVVQGILTKGRGQALKITGFY